MHTLLCVCPPRVGSLFHPVLSKSCNQFPLGFKVWFSRNSSSCCRTPRLGSLMWGSEPSLQWVDFCGISVHQSVSHPPSSYGIRFYSDCAPPTISLWLLLCPWTWGILLGEVQGLPVRLSSSQLWFWCSRKRESWLIYFVTGCLYLLISSHILLIPLLTPLWQPPVCSLHLWWFCYICWFFCFCSFLLIFSFHI